MHHAKAKSVHNDLNELEQWAFAVLNLGVAKVHAKLKRDDLHAIIRSNKLAELSRIEAVLVKIHAGTYQVCSFCKGHITTARLKVRPSSLLCVTCQRNAEGR